VTSGGARVRSGPPPDPTSRTSERRGYVLTALRPYEGEPPDLREFLARPTLRDKKRWAQLWATPQASVWADQPWRWPVVADLVKYLHRADLKDSPTAIATAVRQLRDDLGLSHAGLRAHGWQVADPDTPSEEDAAAPAAPVTDIKSRLPRGRP
jgi:hypothetical protein